MDNELVQEILSRLDAVGEAVSEGAVAGFEVLVRQTVISGATSTIWGLLLTAIAAFCAISFYRSYTDFRDNKLDELRHPDTYRGSVYTWDYYFNDPRPWAKSILAVILGAVGPSILTTGIKQLANPEYYALREVLRTFGG